VVVLWGQSRHDISTQHPPARAATGVNCVESAPKLGMRRQPHSDPGRERRKTIFGESGNPRVCEYAAVLGGWQMPTTQRPPTVRRAVLCESTGSLAPKVAIAARVDGERNHRSAPCGAKLALEKLVV
jgi:hypothetical protein